MWVRLVALLSFVLLPAAISASDDPDSLVGIWGAKRNFGPEVRGSLLLVNSGAGWRAQIGAYDLEVRSENGSLSFELPGARGGFAGRLGRDDVIRGHWVQPPTVNDGGNFNSPVILHPQGKGRWRGEVIPIEDEWTIYLVVTRQPDGSLGGFIRNPDRNIGLRWEIDRITREGNRIRLLGKPLDSGKERVHGEGDFHSEDQRLSLYFQWRGGTYDFVRIDDDPNPGFYARGKNPPPYEYRPPAAIEDGWKVATLDEVGMVVAPLAELVRTVSVPPTSRQDPDIHGLLIARHGKLVFEEYFHGFHRGKPHDTRSASKSIATVLVGAAIQSGAKLEVSTPVYDLLLAEKLPQDIDPRKRRMTVEHLMTMSSGYDCDDWAEPLRPGAEEMLWEERPDEDFYRYTLQLPMEQEPGHEAVYCSINANLLGAVVRAATRRPIREFFQEVIAEPLQIQRYYLNPQPTGEPYLGGGWKLLPRDFMKFGQLFVSGGKWNGRRIFPEPFARRALSPLVTLRGVNIRDSKGKVMQYGYLLWTFEYPYDGKMIGAAFLSGLGGQVVVAIPALDMVIAAYGGNYGDPAGWISVREYIPKFILPALEDPSR